MKKTLEIYYDKDGDFLEIDLGKHKDVIFKNLGKGVFEKVDKKTGQVAGIAIHGFKKKIEHQKFTLPIPVELS